MGMSSSQARLLSLTSRLSDLEYRAQNISNAKMALSRQSDEASKTYIAALDKQKLTVKNSDTDAYQDATVYNLTTYGALGSIDKQRFLKTASGSVIVSAETSNAFEDAKSTTKTLVTSMPWDSDGDGTADKTGFKDQDELADAYLGYHDLTSYEAAVTAGKIDESKNPFDQKQILYYQNIYNGKEAFMQNLGYTSDSTNTNSSLKYDTQAMDYYSKLYDEMQECGTIEIDDTKMNDSDWLYEQLNNGTIFVAEYKDKAGSDGLGDVVNISWSSGDSSLVTKDVDSTELAKAEAEYELATREISQKDKRFDMQLKTIDTEHNATQTEMESLKKIIDKNIERTFKYFDA